MEKVCNVCGNICDEECDNYKMSITEPNKIKETAQIKAEGHVLITDKDTGEVIRDVKNAINFENFSQALALSLADRVDGSILYMVFGNGGSVVSSIGTITYYAPNTTGSATLYNQTYAKIVDDMNPSNTDPTNNYMRTSHVAGLPYSDIQIVCTLEYNEPSGQTAFDNAPLTNNSNPSGTGSVLSDYIFDELGLTTGAATPLLLSHVIFHPVQKSLNRAIVVTYTIRIYLTAN